MTATKHQPDSAIATTAGDGKPHPDGQHVGVCVDCINLGLKAEEWQGDKKLSHKVALVWRSGEKRDDGEFFEVSKEFTLTMGTKGNLRPFLTTWRGKSFTDEEAQGFDVAKLVGAPCILTIEHKISGAGRTYANIVGISKLMKGLEVPDTGEYQRAAYWDKRKKEYAEGVAKHRQNGQDGPPSPEFPPEHDDSDVPF